ncbi:hypothetical protein [Lysinibacillus macroides]|nr:hypothetical protein [Lysinibacillus macroides]
MKACGVPGQADGMDKVTDRTARVMDRKTIDDIGSCRFWVVGSLL